MKRRDIVKILPTSLSIAALPSALKASMAEDPILTHYRDWLAARSEWRELADLSGNEDWDDPRSVDAQARWDAAEEAMLATRPTTMEGVAALAALAWAFVEPGCTDPDELAELTKSYECRAVMAIWKACTGLDGYPVTN